MPLIPNAHPHATVLAVAERAAEPHRRPPAQPRTPRPHPAALTRKGTSRQ